MGFLTRSASPRLVKDFVSKSKVGIGEMALRAQPFIQILGISFLPETALSQQEGKNKPESLLFVSGRKSLSHDKPGLLF